MDHHQQQQQQQQQHGATSLMGLFAPPTPPSSQLRNRKEAPKGTARNEEALSTMQQQQHEEPSSQQALVQQDCEREGNSIPAAPPSSEQANDERTPLLSAGNNRTFTSQQQQQHPQQERSSSLQSLFDGGGASPLSPWSDKQTPKTSGSRKVRNASGIPLLPETSALLAPIREVPLLDGRGSKEDRRRHGAAAAAAGASFFSCPSADQIKSGLQYAAHECTTPSTWIGGFMFLLFQLVYCLTMGATITRPHGSVSMLGLMTKMASLGIIFGAPVYWLNLSDVPALYPTVDLFSAPFLANMALIVDEVLHNDPNVTEEENDQMFLATFTFLASVSLILSGSLLVLASVFKLANLGAFLPFPVLCGFFSAVGILTWELAFKVDSGCTVSRVFLSGDSGMIFTALIHHSPSLIVGSIMKYLTAKNQFFTVACVGVVIALFYFYMFAFGVSMDEMIERKWFWSKSDLHYEPMYATVGFSVWATPAPFGWINAMCGGKVHWGAVAKGFETTVALSFLYLIRCSLHGAALKKNVPNLSRVEKITQEPPSRLSLTRQVTARLANRHKRIFSEAIDIEQVQEEPSQANKQNGDDTHVVTAKPTNASLKEILLQYGYVQYMCALVGSFAVTPCVAVAPTMFTLEAERLAPQLISVILLSVFYLTNFGLVGFIPKTAFSSLLVLAFIDMLYNWFFKSYLKTKEKLEWVVVPLIVIMAFVVGLLQAVFLGVAAATFLFVGTFFRSGVVKYIASGLNIRSTIERPPNAARWLDRNADQIQILVLQNYLFFGNASSILSYITTMFEEPEPDADPLLLPPIPKIIILDLTLVTGIDTSAVDAFSDIRAVCGNHDCKLFLSGVSKNLREVMKLCGIEPENIADRSQRKLRFFSDLDGAVGKAEDMLLKMAPFEVDSTVSSYEKSGGFRHALSLIDEQHQTSFSSELGDLEKYTRSIDVEPGDQLYEDPDMERGLFFVEYGVLKIVRTSEATVSRGVLGNGYSNALSQGGGTLNAMNARTESIGMEMAKMKATGLDAQHTPRFRVARVGPGWVLGNLEALGGNLNTGNTIAVTHCRLHYISYQTILEIEQDDPLMVLRLYKLLSYLMAKRQEITISQLGTLHSIMSAPARKKPLSRSNSRTSLSSIGRGPG